MAVQRTEVDGKSELVISLHPPWRNGLKGAVLFEMPLDLK
mgnify:CR=1 FL=1